VNETIESKSKQELFLSATVSFSVFSFRVYTTRATSLAAVAYSPDHKLECGPDKKWRAIPSADSLYNSLC
jgi:hypothetical protein